MCKINVLKQWIAYILDIQQMNFAVYEKNGKKYIKIGRLGTRKRKNAVWNFQVEHLVNDNLQVTEETLQKENSMIIKSASSR